MPFGRYIYICIYIYQSATTPKQPRNEQQKWFKLCGMSNYSMSTTSMPWNIQIACFSLSKHTCLRHMHVKLRRMHTPMRCSPHWLFHLPLFMRQSHARCANDGSNIGRNFATCWLHKNTTHKTSNDLLWLVPRPALACCCAFLTHHCEPGGEVVWKTTKFLILRCFFF